MMTATQANLFLHDSEREVIAGILAEPAKLGDVRPNLTPECFDDTRYQTLWLVLCELEDRGIPGDIKTLFALAESKDPRDWVAEIRALYEVGVSSGTFVRHHAKLLAGALSMRVLQAATNVISATLAELRPQVPGQAEAAAEDAEALIYAWQTGSSATQPTTAGEGAAAAIRALDSHEPAGLMCGIEALDDTCCGLAPGTMTVIAARTSHGKSTLGLQIALNLAHRGLAALFVSLEMSEQQTMRRALSNLSGVSHSRILRKAVPADDRGLLVEASETLKGYGDRLQVYSPGAIGPSLLRSIARRMRSKHKGCVLIVDYLQLLEMPEASTREQAVAAASRSLKQTAELVGIPVVVLAQLNRAAVHDDRPQLHHLRESGAIEQDADTVLLLQVAESDEQATSEAIPMQIHVAKNRAGPRAAMTMTWRRPLFRIEDPERTDGPTSPPGSPPGFRKPA